MFHLAKADSSQMNMQAEKISESHTAKFAYPRNFTGFELTFEAAKEVFKKSDPQGTHASRCLVHAWGDQGSVQMHSVLVCFYMGSPREFPDH